MSENKYIVIGVIILSILFSIMIFDIKSNQNEYKYPISTEGTVKIIDNGECIIYEGPITVDKDDNGDYAINCVR